MTTRGQNLRSSTPGNKPAAGSRAPGEIWINFADRQLGYIDAGKASQPVVAVRYFATTSNYAIGDFVVQAGALYVATTAVSAGAFNSGQWSQIAALGDIPVVYVLPTASTTVLGGVKVDGTTIKINSGVISASGLAAVATTPPVSPQNGSQWYDLMGGQLYVWVNDGTSSQWVIAVNQSLGGVYLPLNGGTLTGPLILYADPVAPLEAVTKQYSDAHAAINDNRIINGDMRIDQRNNGASGTAAGYTVDRWGYAAAQTGKGTWQRGTGGPAIATLGFPYYLTFTSSSAYASVAADQFHFNQPIEADMVSDLAWGTPNAQPVTLSFWASSSLTGTFSGSIFNYPATATRSYPFSFSLPTANTWTKIVIAIPGDTAGAWVMSGNAASFGLAFDLGCGANFRAAAGTWVSGNYRGATGSQSVVSTNGAAFSMTGVKLEIGSIATPFNRQSLAKSMADCQRYFQWLPFHMQISAYAAGGVFQSTIAIPVTMRASPTISAVAADPNLSQQAANATTYSFGLVTPYGAVTTLVAAAAGQAYLTGYRSSASAEL